MGTKRKADDEILEIPSDDDDDEGQQQLEEGVARNGQNVDGADSDVEIQERPIPVVNVDDDDEPPPDDGGGQEAALTDSPASPSPTPVATCAERPEDGSKQTEMGSDKPLLSLTFRDASLFQLFQGSLTEYLKTTFQLKLGGQEVEVLHQVETCSIQVRGKREVPSSEPVPCPETPKAATAKAADDDGMFVIDSTPAKTAKGGPIVPSYKKALQKVLDNTPTAGQGDSATKKPKPRQLCWNCDGDHGLRDCKEPRNFAKISKMKQEYMKKMDRYHVDLEQKYGHIVPGRLSEELRQALGLKKRDLPVHIYRMRMFGYPPGWLEEAKITHSGLQLFDSRGDPVLDSDESDGEVDNVKHKYDVRKIISYPGFNVPAGAEFYDDSKFFGVPPLLEHQSRERMIQSLEGTLVQGYRRKKLRLTTATGGEGVKATSADMELDDNPDESFTTLDSVGDCDSLRNGGGPPAVAVNRPKDDEEPEEGEVDEDGDELRQPEVVPEVVPEPPAELNGNEEVGSNKDDTAKDDSLILVEEETEVICLDDTRPASPSLEDLHRQQQELLQQLEDQSPLAKRRRKGLSTTTATTTSAEDSLLEDVLEVERLAEEQQEKEEAFVFALPPLPPSSGSPPQERPPEPEFLNLDEIKMSKTPFIDDPASMGLKTMSLGTPILTAFSPFNTLPCGEAFSKGVSDVINFENLPNSTGKYERMKSLLSKVRTVIHAHNGELDADEDQPDPDAR